MNLSADGFTETRDEAALITASNVVDAAFTTQGLRTETDMHRDGADATVRGMMG